MIELPEKQWLVVDKSSIAGAYLHLKDEAYGETIRYKGETYHIPDTETCMERFLYSLNNLLKGFGFKTTDIVFVCDPKIGKSQKTRRRAILPEYKSKVRVAPPRYFKVKKDFFAMIDEWAFNNGAIIATPPPDLEADDLINEFASRIPNTIIWSRDKDMLACPANVILQGAGEFDVNPEKFPVANEHIHIYRAIVEGDNSDNVKASNGFGKSAWEKMVAKFGESAIKDLDDMVRERALDELEESVDAFPKFQKLIDHADDIYAAYDVMSFFKVPAHKIRWKPGMLVGQSTLVTKKNYKKVFELLKGKEFDYSIIDFETDTPPESKAWCEQTSDDEKERVKVDVMSSRIAGMGLRVGTHNYYFCVDHADTDNITLDELEAVLELLYDKPVFAHNSTGFENPVIYNHFGAFLPGMRDSQIMASYVAEADPLGLKWLSKKHFDYDQISYEQVLNGRSGMWEVSGKEVFDYGIDDVIVPDALQNYFMLRMLYENTFQAFEKVDIDSAFFTSLCFVGGAHMDQEEYDTMNAENARRLEDTWEALNKELLALEWEGAVFKPVKGKNFPSFNKVYTAIYGESFDHLTTVKGAVRFLCGEEIATVFRDGTLEDINTLYKKYWKPKAELNFRSPTQMRKLLYEKMELPIRIRKSPTDKMRSEGKQGNPSTDETAIKNAIAFEDNGGIFTKLLEAIIEHKKYLTRKSLFFNPYPRLIHWETGKLHCNMRQCAALTRRHTHSKPNLAQMSKKKGKKLRNLITVPGEGWYIVTFDIDSQELKIQAWASQDANFLSCYIGDDKKDVHSLTGFEVARMQGTPFPSYEDFVLQLDDGGEAKPFRVKGKTTNFSTAYLCTVRRLAHELAVPEEIAQKFFDAKAAAFPGLSPAVEEYNKVSRERGYALTMMGARRHLAVLYARARGNKGATAAIDRLAWSFHIQGSAGEQIRLANARMWQSGIFNNPLVKPIVDIHDEAVFYIHESAMEESLSILHKCMCEQYADMEIEQSSTPEYGTHFGSLKNYEVDR